jgi:hypothetical protein
VICRFPFKGNCFMWAGNPREEYRAAALEPSRSDYGLRPSGRRRSLIWRWRRRIADWCVFLAGFRRRTCEFTAGRIVFAIRAVGRCAMFSGSARLRRPGGRNRHRLPAWR